MTSLTERYLAAVLRAIPESKRADVDRELRSSIADAIDDRVGNGETRDAAERAVLVGLGDPQGLAASMAGRPNYLIGPALFPQYRRLLGALLLIVVPVAGLAVGAVSLAMGDTIGQAIVDGGSTAFNVGVQLAFWVTLVVAFLERADTARHGASAGPFGAKWSLDDLPEAPSDRITVGDTISDIVASVIAIVFLLIIANLTWTSVTTAERIPIVASGLTEFWLPFLVVVQAALLSFYVVLHLVGRWTLPLFVTFAVLSLAFGIPVVYLALNGMLINPDFAASINWPQLAEASGPVMILIAVGVVIVTGWEIFDAFRKTLRTRTTVRA